MSIPQSYTEFEATLEKSNPPTHWPEALQALWFQAKGDWEASHNIAQELHTAMGSLIHAHLHRDEGDDWNEGYRWTGIKVGNERTKYINLNPPL